MGVRIHHYDGGRVRAEVTAYKERYRVNVSGPRHARGLLPIITEESEGAATSHADSLALELYPHACAEAACGEWAQEGADG